MKIESIDGRYVRCRPYKSDGENDIESWKNMSTHSNSTIGTLTGYNTEASRDAWYYFKVDQQYSWGASLYYDNRALRYDRFKITVTEHPIIKHVTGMAASKRTKKSITLKWNNQANATKYQVKWKKKGGSWKTATVTTNSKKYQFKVRAYCANSYDLVNNTTTNWTAWSAAKTAKTKK